AACLGVLKKCLWLARVRAQSRVQYDHPIGEHTDIGSKLVAMASRVLALEALVKITGVWADAKQDVRLESAAAKILATEWLLEGYFKQGQAFLDMQVKAMLHATPFFVKVVSRSFNGLPAYKNGAAHPYEAWERFVEEKSRELARKILLVTARHRRRLVPKQML